MSKIECELYSQAPPPVADGDALAEALWLFQTRDGGDGGEIRALIAVPPMVEGKLRAFAKTHPIDAEWVARCLAYRRAVLREFDRLTDEASRTILPAPPNPAEPLPVCSPVSVTLELQAL
jgi:hypothetical protein